MAAWAVARALVRLARRPPQGPALTRGWGPRASAGASASPPLPGAKPHHDTIAAAIRRPRGRVPPSPPTWGVCAAAGAAALASSVVAECSGASLLDGREDNFGGIIVDPDSLPADPDEFAACMALSLSEWAAAGKRGIWLKVPVEKAALIAGAVELGFELHHAEKPYVMMTTWLADGESTIPVNASHQVGIGAIVLNRDGDILVVQEKNGPLKGQGVWKMPTGLIHAGEDLSTGAEREVLEETGVEARFESVLCFRHAHGVAFGKSDLFFVCLLRELGEPRAPVPCETEIEAVRWMPLQEYFNLGWYKEGSVYTRIMEVIEQAAAGEYGAGYVAESLPIGFRPGDNFLYHGARGPPPKAEGGSSRL